MSKPFKHNRNGYLEHKCRCTICVDANKEYRYQYNKSEFKLDVEVFVQRLTEDGRVTGLGSHNVAKWRARGLDVFSGDKWAVKLGYHPYEIWGDAFYQGCDGYVKG